MAVIREQNLRLGRSLNIRPVVRLTVVTSVMDFGRAGRPLRQHETVIHAERITFLHETARGPEQSNTARARPQYRPKTPAPIQAPTSFMSTYEKPQW